MVEVYSEKFFFGSRSNVEMNVKMTNYWARPISGFCASLTLNFSYISENFWDKCLYISVALNGFQAVVEVFPGLLFIEVFLARDQM